LIQLALSGHSIPPATGCGSTSSNWYLWTTERAVILNQLLRPLVGSNGSVVILQIDTSADSERWGSAPQAVWDWINDKRDKAILGAY
jgi:hypothetical protein